MTHTRLKCLLVSALLVCACDDDPAGEPGLEVKRGKNAVEAELDTRGGVLELRNRARLTIPEGALADSQTIRVEVGEEKKLARPGGEYEVIGEPLVITPHGLRLEGAATIEIAIDDEDSPQKELKVLRLKDEDDRSWEEIEGAVLADADEDSRFTRDITVRDDGDDSVSGLRRLEFQVETFSVFLPVRLVTSSGSCVGKAKGFVCRASSGDCDAAEECDGSSDQCPADAVSERGTQCRVSSGLCDVAESCDGDSPSCPADGVRAAESVCRPSREACDVVEVCDGSAVECPEDSGSQCSGQWNVPELLESDDAGDALNPQIAVDPAGNAVAVWHQSDGTRNNVWASRYTAANTTWGAPELLENDDAGVAESPRVAMDPDGNAIAVWEQDDGVFPSDIWANRYDAGAGTWGTAVPVLTSGLFMKWPDIAVGADGNAVAVWAEVGGGMWTNRFDSGAGTWGTAEMITSGTSAQRPRVAVDSAGDATVVWYDNDGVRNNIRAMRYDAGLALWSSPEDIETDDGDGFIVLVEIDANDNAIAIWHHSDGTRNSIWANRYDAGAGTWGTGGPIEVEDGEAHYARVAFDAAGNAIAVWAQSDGTQNNIVSSKYDVGNDTWSVPEAIETSPGDADIPMIEIDANGNATVVWYQSNGNQDDIWANRYDAASSSWGTAELLETDDAGDALYPELALDANGNALTVWQQSDGTRSSIWGSVYRLAQ